MTGYAGYYNRSRNRAGHVFQNRYKSIVCDKDNYLLPLIRYIHLNPVKAKVGGYSQLNIYRWSGHRELIKEIKEPSIIAKEEVLSYFGKTEKKAAGKYQEYMRGGLDGREEYEGGGLICSLGENFCLHNFEAKNENCAMNVY